MWLSVSHPSTISFVYKVKYKLLRLACEVLMIEFLPLWLAVTPAWPWTQHSGHCPSSLKAVLTYASVPLATLLRLSIMPTFNLPLWWISTHPQNSAQCSPLWSLSSQVEMTFHSLVPPMYPIKRFLYSTCNPLLPPLISPKAMYVCLQL